MVKKNRNSSVVQPLTGPIDCACVIHGNGYSWDYVDRLYSMLTRNITLDVQLHVYTEPHRDVPAPYIKHGLLDWGVSGPKKSWWYKMQLFNSDHHQGPLLYFDLDTVIVKNIDWIWNTSLNYFWAVKDFKYLWRPDHSGVNSSIMWFDTTMFDYVWRNVKIQEITRIISKYRGDQDYINDVIPQNELRLFDSERIKSWRWECLDGSYNFTQRRYLTPHTGTIIPEKTSVLVFHGKPKPGEVTDSLIVQHWQ